MAIDRKAMKNQLQKRLEEQNKAKDRGLNDYESYFNVPEGVNQWIIKPQPEPGLEIGFDIIPFIAGDNYPTNGYNINEGDLTYLLDIWVHRGVGACKKPVVCPLKNYSQPCPVCEKRIEVLAEAGSMEAAEYNKFKKEHSELWPSRRVIYNAISRSDEKEEKKGIQILENAHFFFEKKLQEVAKRPRGGGLIAYPDPDEGKTIWMNLKKLPNDNWEVSPPTFEDRKYVISDEEIETAQQLDQLITLHSYEEIQLIMGAAKKPHVTDSQPMENDVPLVSRRSPKPVQEDKGVNTNTGEITCPIDADFGDDYDKYEECDKCKVKMYCKDVAESANELEPEPEPEPEVEEEEVEVQEAPKRRRTLKE